MVLFCLQNISLRASFTDSIWLVFWYKITVKRSRIVKLSLSRSIAVNGSLAMLTKASVASGKHFQASHPVFFPFPRKEDTVSQPVKL